MGRTVHLRRHLTEAMSPVGGEAAASGQAPPAPGGAAAMLDARSAGGSESPPRRTSEPSDSSNAPRPSHGRPGHFGHYNIPHAVGWTVGTWAGATRRTVSSAFRSSQSEQQEEG